MRLYQPASIWWVDFTVDGQRHRESTGLRDKNAATARAASMVRDAELKAAGIDTHGATTRATLACLFGEYRAELTRRRCAPKHVETTLARCTTLAEGCTTVAELTTNRVRLALDRLRGASAKTINGYRTALFGFFAWLAADGKWTGNPVEAVERVKDFGGRKRRALTPDEQRRLLALDVPGHAAYAIMLNTGLRRAEFDALTDDDFVHDPGWTRVAVRVRSGTAKNRKEALLPLPRGFTLLRKHPLKAPTMAAFRRDLKTAGIVDDGSLDLHSLRRSFATNLARAGVPLTVAQRLMRHSDPALTSNIYTSIGISDEQEAVDRAVPDYNTPVNFDAPLGHRHGAPPARAYPAGACPACGEPVPDDTCHACGAY